MTQGSPLPLFRILFSLFAAAGLLGFSAVAAETEVLAEDDPETAAEESLEPAVVDPVAMYLSWQRDPTSTMTIQWHTEGESDDPAVMHAPIGREVFDVTSAKSHPMVYSDRMVHTVEITGLEPDSVHEFRLLNIAGDKSSPIYRFRTMQERPDRPIRIAIGGDVLHQADWMEQVNRQAMRFDPDFIIWGGDLAYSDGREDRVEREYTFFRVMMETLIAEDGRVVPVIMGIGNHEILGGYYWGHGRERAAYEDTDEFREWVAPYYYNLHAFPGHPGYGVLDFGEYMSLILLDSDHSGPVEGTQTEWLDRVLSERQDVPHILPVYHVPAFPSVRSYDGGVSRNIRENWLPVLEKYGVRIAFENHDHAYKRTVPIRSEEQHEDGIIFLGDGAWGVGERAVHDAKQTWYLERSESIRHLILMTIQDEFQDFKVINREGELIDHYIPRIRTPAVER